MGALDAAALVQELRDVFATGKTKSSKWRKEQLNAIARLVDERSQELSEALKLDLHRTPLESIQEINGVKEVATTTAEKLDEWMAPEKVSSPVPHFANAAIIPEPLGVVLVISPWNYPFGLCLDPIASAVAAGNVVVLKPSRLAPATTALIAKLLPLYMDPSAVRVVQGGVPETTALLEQRWDKIFYTGSTRVGKIIMAAAAKHLTPVTLELGGKSPAIVDSTADLDVVARRITLGKWSINDGQACIVPDYVLAKESITFELVEKIKDAIKQFYGKDPSTSPDMGRIINTGQFTRLTRLLNDDMTSKKVVHGGQHNEKALYIEPTLVLDPPLDSPIMQEEIFGPLLVIIPVKDVNDAIKFVNSRPKPLALYVFTNDQKVADQVLLETSSGGVTVNDIFLHVAHPDLPFGGVGESGMGKYKGKSSFDTFSHKKSIVYQTLTGDVSARYPPYDSN